MTENLDKQEKELCRHIRANLEHQLKFLNTCSFAKALRGTTHEELDDE